RRQTRRGDHARAGRGGRRDQSGEDDLATRGDLPPERLPPKAAAPTGLRERALGPQHGQGAAAAPSNHANPRRGGEPAHLSTGLFITFEGTEGSGKTTQVELLGEKLSYRQPVVVREPGGTELGERMRQLLLFSGMEIDGEAEMYIFMAARRQLLQELIVPSLALGRIVMADSYHASTLPSQG